MGPTVGKPGGRVQENMYRLGKGFGVEFRVEETFLYRSEGKTDSVLIREGEEKKIL